MSHLLEYIGSALGMAGALLLAANTKISKFGWLAFLLSNAALIALFVRMGTYGLLTQQAFFTGTSLLGLARTGMLDWAIQPVMAIVRSPSERRAG